MSLLSSRTKTPPYSRHCWNNRRRNESCWEETNRFVHGLNLLSSRVNIILSRKEIRSHIQSTIIQSTEQSFSHRETNLDRISGRTIFRRQVQSNFDPIPIWVIPLFFSSLPVPFISSSVQSKLAIRAVLLNDLDLLKSLINDVDRVCTVRMTGLKTLSSIFSRFTFDEIFLKV